MKWFHVIGVCGKTTANIAKMFQDEGWFVTGSDNQFLPPASELLERNKIKTVQDFNFKHLTREFWEETLGTDLKNDINENPDLVLFISHLTSKNKEYLFAKKRGLDIKPYARILNEYLIKPESVVIVGTAGKTTTTALTTFLFQKLGFNPSYMIGADVVDITESLVNTDSEWSVIEGDEYHNPDPEVEGKAKFLEYKPKYLIIPKISWEHVDIFPTEERYVEEFKKVVELVPADGLIIAKYGDKNIDSTLVNAKAKVIRYAYRTDEIKSIEDVWSVEKQGDINFIYNPKGEKVLEFETELLGSYNLENILSVVILLSQLTDIGKIKIDNLQEKLKTLINEFHGVKKRLEFLYKSKRILVVDDFGIAPERAKNSLETIAENYPEHKIIGIFEPNAGSRPKDLETFERLYKDSFTKAEKIYIPDLSEGVSDLVSSQELAERLNKLGYNAEYSSNLEIPKKLAEILKSDLESQFVIVFFSSYKLTNIAREFVKGFTSWHY